MFHTTDVAIKNQHLHPSQESQAFQLIHQDLAHPEMGKLHFLF